MADFEVKENINLGGNKIKNAGFEVVTSLPTTNNFVGRQVTYQGKSYIWNGSAWKCDADTLGGRNPSYYITNDDVIQNTNPFGGRKLYINSLDNALAAADKKYFVIITIHKKNVGGIDYPKPINVGNILLPQWEDSPIVSNISSQASNLFNNSYENGINIPADSYAKIRINWNQDGSGYNPYPYPYGKFYLSYYYDYTPDIGNCVRFYNSFTAQGVGYKTINFTDFLGVASINYIQQAYNGSNVTIRELEFIVFGKLIRNSSTILTQIELKLDRPSFADTSPLFTTYGSNKAYYPFRLGTNLANNLTLNPDGTIVSVASITSNETINFDTNNIEPTQTGTVTKTSTWLWQYLTQSVNFLWLKLKDLFPTTQATTHNYLPKIDNSLKKLVKSNIYDDGTTPKYGANTIWHSGNDGSNSGLDADLLDGSHASDFATSTHNHNTAYLGITAKASDSDKLDGYHASDFVTSVTKAMVEAVLIGIITSHQHNYTTSTDVSNLINTAIASVYKPKGNIADKTALLALTNIKQGDVYNAQASFTLNGQNVKAGDNIVCLSDAATSLETNWDNLGGNIDFAAALSQALIGFSATSGNISSSDTILSAINKLAYDKHIHGNLNVLDLTTAAFTTEFKNQLSQTYSALHSHDNKTTLDAITAAFTTALKTSYDGAVSNSHTHSNKAILDAISASFTTALKTSYDSAVTNSHTHSNKTVLDALTQGVIDNSHTHSNKTTLDAITAAFTTALKTNYDSAYTNSHTHSNKTILDAISASFTTALKTSYDSAATNSHTHGNKTVLDALTQAIIDNSHTHSNSTALGNVSGTNTGDENTTRIGTLINGATAKTTPVDADMVGLMDSAASNVLKKLSWAKIKDTLKTYFDSLYTKLSFSRIRVGGVDIAASTNEDRIEFIAGTNVTLTPDAGGKKLTIAAAGGGSSYRGIKVNNTLVLDSSNSSPINICDGIGTIVDGVYFGGEYILAISAYMGLLTDINGVDLQVPGKVGVWTLIPDQHYFNTPNPICGTDTDSSSLSGTYTYVANDSGGTWTYHDQNTNKMYISSWYNDPVNGDTLNPWKRLLTCADEIATEPEEINPYEYVINSTNQYIYIDSKNFDFEDTITIDLANYSSPGYMLKISIYFNTDTGSAVNVNIIDSANPGKQIKYGNSPHYVDPGSVGSLYCINYEIACFIPYWLVGNRIYS